MTISATSFIFGLTDCYSQAAQLVLALVRKDLQANFFPRQRPPAELENLSCRFVIMERTLPRMYRYKDTPLGVEKQQRLKATYRRLCNGDLRGGQFQHFCHEDGCCENHQQTIAVRDLTAFILELIFAGLGVDRPSEERWATVEPHSNRQALGQSTYGVLRRIVSLICGDSTIAADVPLDGFHAESSRKKVKSYDFHTDEPGCSTKLLKSVFVIAPLAYLSAHIQKLDDEGGGMLAMVDSGPDGMLAKCQRWLWELLHPHSESRHSLELPALLWHTRAAETNKGAASIIDSVRAMSTTAGAGMFIRFQTRYHECPFFAWLHGELIGANAKFSSTRRLAGMEACSGLLGCRGRSQARVMVIRGPAVGTRTPGCHPPPSRLSSGCSGGWYPLDHPVNPQEESPRGTPGGVGEPKRNPQGGPYPWVDLPPQAPTLQP